MKRNSIEVLFSVLCFVSILSCSKPVESNPPIAILGAFSVEIDMLKDSLTNKYTEIKGGIEFTRGELSGKDVVIAFTGIGKVNAAMTSTLILEYYHPSKVIFTGIAGGINPLINPADLVVSERCVHHDLNYYYDDTLVSYQPRNPLNNTINPVFFNADSSMLQSLKSIAENSSLIPIISGLDSIHPKIVFGTIATGDAFIASQDKNIELIERFNADAVEMEGAAIAQICYQRNIPFIIIRSISDSADENAKVDLEEFYLTAAKNANFLVIELLKVLAD
jgi:adenosylhomocysteine nucleosidase